MTRLLAIASAALVVTALGWFAAAHYGANRSVHMPATQVAHVTPSADVAVTPWTVPTILPEPIPHATKTPAPQKAAAPEPDWTAFSIGLSEHTNVAAAAPAKSTAPADLDVKLSPSERLNLIAAARDAESAPAPPGYRPGIAVVMMPSCEGDEGGTSRFRGGFARF